MDSSDVRQGADKPVYTGQMEEGSNEQDNRSDHESTSSSLRSSDCSE